MVALTAVITRRRIGALMTGFEVVEIAVIGLTALDTPDQPAAWLQVFFLLPGAAIALLGARLLKAESRLVSRVAAGVLARVGPACTLAVRRTTTESFL